MLPDALSPEGSASLPRLSRPSLEGEWSSAVTSPQSGWLGASSPGAPPAACRAQGPGSEHAAATHVHVVHVLVPVPPLLHVGAQRRDGRGALFEGCKGRQATRR